MVPIFVGAAPGAEAGLGGGEHGREATRIEPRVPCPVSQNRMSIRVLPSSGTVSQRRGWGNAGKWERRKAHRYRAERHEEDRWGRTPRPASASPSDPNPPLRLPRPPGVEEARAGFFGETPRTSPSERTHTTELAARPTSPGWRAPVLRAGVMQAGGRNGEHAFPILVHGA